MFESGLILLDWVGVIAFTITGALVASRNQMDVIGFVLLGTVTGIGGGTLRDLLLGIHPILWIDHPEYLAVCFAVSVVVFFTAHLAISRYRMILWLDAVGLSLFATVGAGRALESGAAPIVAVTMGVITACFGGIIRDTLGREESIIFFREIYVTAAAVSALVFVALDTFDWPREISISAGVLSGLCLRAGALLFDWSLPRYRSRPTGV